MDDEYQVIDVQTGEVKAGRRNTVLSSTAIGSCIAVVAVDAVALIGGIAHIMLPGIAPVSDSERPHTRYAENGFSALVESIKTLGGKQENFLACLAGGANVLKDPQDSICRENINAVIGQCSRYRIPIAAQSLGGFQRRRVTLDIRRSLVSCGIGDQAEFVLWSFQ